MAIGINSIVAPNIAIATAPVVQGPIFGISESAGAPFTVLWSNGNRVAGIPGTSLVEIAPADLATREAFVGRRVRVTTPSGQNNWGICVCVGAYKQGGASGGNTLLLQNPVGQYFIEVLPADCEVVA